MLGIFRIVIGLMFALHGTAKVFGWTATKMGAIPVGTWHARAPKQSRSSSACS